jgi:hypothetical protein
LTRPLPPRRASKHLSTVICVESGVPVSVFNLGSVNSSAALEAALAHLRPDPARRQIEQLASVGNSFYHGLPTNKGFAEIYCRRARKSREG